MFETPDKRRDCAAGDTGFVVKGAGRLAADGRPENAVAAAFVRGADHIERSGLAGARNPDDQVDAATRGENATDCTSLAVRE